MKEYIMNRDSLKRHCEAMCHRFKNIPTSGAYGEHRLVLELLEQTEWIPVSERLPNDEDYILVCYEDGHIRTAYYYIDTDIYPSEFEDCCETGWYNYNEDFMYEQDVIAWMPLPEPYKVEPQERSGKE